MSRGAATGRPRNGSVAAWAFAVALGSGFGCGKHGAGSLAGAGSCGHAVCDDHFFVDALPPVACEAGTLCRVTVKLGALGEFHVNDEYSYQFQADETPGIQFTGAGTAARTVFSKAFGDWRKDDAQSGSMTIGLFPSTPGAHAISGVFKLSVCSAAKCLLEQRPISVSFAAE